LYRDATMRQTAAGSRGIVVLYLIAIATVAALVALFQALRLRALARRNHDLRSLLDGADALENQLLTCRSRMQQLRGMLSRLPEEMSADADAALTADDKVQAGLRDLLAHRLWIKQHADTASSADIAAARAAIEQSSEIMRSQLERLATITRELAAAQTSASTVTPRDPAASR
jgi:hypothetical protein